MTENQPKTKNIYQKTIAQLIKELQSFEDQSLIVMVTSNCGETFKPVELVSKGFQTSRYVRRGQRFNPSYRGIGI